MHTRARKLDEQEQILTKNQWWDAAAKIEDKTVSDTIIDEAQEASLTQTWKDESPEKSRSPPQKSHGHCMCT